MWLLSLGITFPWCVYVVTCYQYLIFLFTFYDLKIFHYLDIPHSVHPLFILLSVDGQLAFMNNASLHIWVQVFVWFHFSWVYT